MTEYQDEQGRWSAEGDDELLNSTFNCCTFAVGDVLGLKTSDWIVTSACMETDHTFPMQIVFNSFFDLVRHYQVSGVAFDWERIQVDGGLEEDDVLSFVQTTAANGASPRIIHTGRILRRDGRNWLASKIGIGPILVTTIEALAREYAGAFDLVQVHRLRASNG